MPTGVLSQDEISQLLTAINAGDTEPEDFKPDLSSRKIKIYDFKRPDKFTKEEIRSMSIIHETFARLSGAAISSLTRCSAHVHVASVDQLTYEEFIRSIPTPTALGIIDMNPIIGNAVIEIDPFITSSILSLITGGTGEIVRNKHELTELEKLLIEDVFLECLNNLKESWKNILDLNPALVKIDANPQFVQVVPPTEMAVLVTLEVKLGDVEGMINLCYPYIIIKPIIEKLSSSYYYAPKGVKSFNINQDDIEVYLTAEIFKTKTTIGELKKLKTGSVIKGTSVKLLKANDIIIGEWDHVHTAVKTEKKSNYEKVLITSIYTIKEKDYMSEKNNISANEALKPEVLDEIEVQIICELGRTKAAMKEIKNYGEGTIIELDTLAGEPVNVFANNKLIAKGEVVVIDENFGVRITESAIPKTTD